MGWMGLAKKFHLGRLFSLVLTLFLAASIGITGMFLTAYGLPNRQVGQTFKDKGWQDREYIPLNETAGVDRVLEPAEYVMEFEDGKCRNASKEIRVAAKIGGEEIEVPSQVYNVSTYESGNTKSCIVVFLANCTALSTAEYFIYYNNPAATKPTYATDLSYVATNVNITVWNTYYRACFFKADPKWYGIPDSIKYLYCNAYKPTENLARADWNQILMTVINVHAYWFGPFPGGKPVVGTNVSISEQGPVFIEVKAELGGWPPVSLTGVNSYVKTYRFYARIPWFIFSIHLNLTAAYYEHIQSESYLSTTALSYVTYRTKTGSLTTINIAPDQGDFLDWDGTWIHAETTNKTDNPVGLGFIAMLGTDPSYAGFRSDRYGVAPFQNGTIPEARQNLAILVHKGSYIAAAQLYNQTQKLLLPPPLLQMITSITILATAIDKVSGVGSPNIKVELLFRDNRTLYRETETNELGTAIFRDVPSGNYTVRALGESVNMTVSLKKAYWSVRLRVMIPRFTGLIYTGIAIGVCVALIAVISVMRRRRK